MRTCTLFASLLLGAAVGPFCAADDKEEIAKGTKDLKSKEAKVRLKAVERLADLGEAAALPLCDAMLDANTKVATAALTALEKAHPKLYKLVSVMVLDRYEPARLGAVRQIGELGTAGRPTLKLLIARLQTEMSSEMEKEYPGPPEPAVAAYFKSVCQVGGEDDECVQFVKQLAAGRSTLRPDAFQWMLSWAGDKEARRKELLPLIKARLTDRSNAIPYIKAAGNFGALAKDTLPALKKLKLSDSDKIREEATKAIQLIEAP